MSNDKRQNIFLGAAAILAIGLSIFGLISFFLGSQSFAAKILTVICSALLLVLAALYITAMMLSANFKRNFFSRDRRNAKDVPVKELDYSIVADRIDSYIDYLGGSNALILNHLLEIGDFGTDNILRPVVVYRLLHKAPQDNDVFSAIENADNKTVRIICQSLEYAGEKDMADAIIKYKQSSGASEKFRRFLLNNQKYIQSRTLAYVRKNIEFFY